MYLMGHTDATLTLAVYQQVLDMGRGSVEILEELLGCTLVEARAIYNGDVISQLSTRSAAQRASMPGPLVSRRRP